MSRKSCSAPAIRINVVAFFLISLLSASNAFPWGTTPYSSNSSEICMFTLQLKDPLVRKQYMVKVVEAQQEGSYSSASVAGMYANVREASYDTQNNDYEGFFDDGNTRMLSEKFGIDSLSAGCLTCHDGSIAVSMGVNLKNNPFGRRMMRPGQSSEHPIGMDYALYAGVNSDFKPLMNRANKMIFVNGKVGCLTCHDPLNPEKNHLVMSDRRSALCLTCHDK